MLNNYETVFILTPVLSDEQAKETVKRYKDYLKENGATLVHEENWGLKKLAYPIKKKSSGFYSLFQFTAEGSFINDFEIAFKRDERILRFLTVSLDKFSLEYAEKRRTRRAEMKNNRDNKQVETV
jgi:small subunit ribosomal protein S6